jgi:hypothetical protein
MWVTKSTLYIVSRINTQTQSNTDTTTGKTKGIKKIVMRRSLVILRDLDNIIYENRLNALR